jgi:hypothetical protein
MRHASGDRAAWLASRDGAEKFHGGAEETGVGPECEQAAHRFSDDSGERFPWAKVEVRGTNGGEFREE